MAEIFDTADLSEDTIRQLDVDQVAWVYNGLDCCVTAQVRNVLAAEINLPENETVAKTYNFAMEKNAAIFKMGLRGMRVDLEERQRVLEELKGNLRELEGKFQYLCKGALGHEVNWRSPKQLNSLFYKRLGLTAIKKRSSSGDFAATTNQDALEKLRQYMVAQPFCNFILDMRNIQKRVGFLETKLDKDGRMRTTYNIAGTNTGRLSSRMSEFETGTNLQNVDRRLRQSFVADEGFVLLNIDLEQADSRNVGAVCYNIALYMSREEIAELLGVSEWTGPVGHDFAASYLDACESSDLHTTVCRMTWPGLAWPTPEEEWKSFCKNLILFGQDSYRQVAKKLGHGTNYYGQPSTMALHTKSPVKIITAFQHNYFKSFPVIKLWHNWVIRKLKEDAVITSLFGRRRHFFDRPSSLSTIRKAIAYCGQSPTGHEIDQGLYQIEEYNKAFGREDPIQLLNQVHDSILMQVPFEALPELAPKIKEVMRVELPLVDGRIFSVPLELKCGWNWGDYDYENPGANPYGLKENDGLEDRQPPPPIRKRTRLRDHL